MVRFAGSSFLLGLVLGCGSLVAQAGSSGANAFGGAAFSVSVEELRAASAEMPPTKDYGTEILYEEGKYQIGESGLLTYTHRMIYRVDTDATVMGWAEISSNWDPWYEKPSQIHARVLQPNGTYAELDQKTVTDAPVKAEDDETFSSEHVRRAPLPGMAIGSIVEEQEIVEEKTPYFPGAGLYRFGFQENVPVRLTKLIVETPAGVPFHEKLHNLPGVVIERKELGGKRLVVYKATSIDPSHDSDIDLATNEPTTPLVEFATGTSWAAVAKTYATMSDPQTVTADTEGILPKDLPAERMARIRAVVKVLHHDVRYTGVEFGAARLTPMRPAEVIKRHYGDCKDKATLLVAMLRAAGIKADLALLSTGPGRDVDDSLPGVNRFDHAIVYVPADGANGAIWIDATAEFFSVGSLPYDDEGRKALVISPETTGLTMTPKPKSEDSVLVETRTFKLAGLGPSTIEETSETQGYVDALYRSDYGGPETPKVRENMENYVKNAYLAKKLTKFEHGDSADLDHPFKLTLDAEGAKRGNSSLVDAVAVIFPATTANTLPKWFSEQPPVLGPDASADQKKEMELQVKSRPATFAMRPYIYELRAKVIVPPGFILRSLPADKTTRLGQATLTESYSAKNAGLVEATFRFNSGPSEMTAEQALAMRTAILELDKRDYVGIFFDQAGAKAMNAGHIKEALEIDRKLIDSEPKDALGHLHLARVLLDAGIGSEAQVEAKRATELNPKLSAGYYQYGLTLEHNALGERFGKGFDLPGAIAALRRAIELDEEDNDPRFDLAVLLEFDAQGDRYASDSDMTGAIKEYKALIELNKAKGDEAFTQYRENLLYALLYTRQFGELDKMLASLPSTNSHLALAISSAAAQHGAAAGVAQADKGNASAADRNANLRLAGNHLANLKMYPLAADVMAAGIQGGTDAATVSRQVDLYRGINVAALTPLPKTNPATPVQGMLIGLMAGTLTRAQAGEFLSHRAYASQASFDQNVSKNLASAGFMRRVAERGKMEPSVLVDLIAGNTIYTSKGDDATGYAVAAQMPGSAPTGYFVVKEDGAYRIVGDEHDRAEVGHEVLWELEHNQAAAAKTLLDWERNLLHKEGGDDAYSGPLLPRFWTVGSTKPGADSPEVMRLAAISLLTGKMDAKPYLVEIAGAREKATGALQTDFDLLLAEAAMGAEQPAAGMDAAKRLLEAEPDSLTALHLAGRSYELTSDAPGWQAMLTPRLAKKPGDHDLLSEQVSVYQVAHDWPGAQAAAKKVLDSGKATSTDYNQYAWLGLFHNDYGDDITKAAQQSTQMSGNSNFNDMHTLACIYAAEGKTSEARQVLQQAMAAAAEMEPNSAVWYALGLIYEQYGAKVAALNAFKKVQAHELDDHTFVEPTSPYVLAQEQIEVLSK